MTLRVGIGGPVGSGKTALTLALCKAIVDEKLPLRPPWPVLLGGVCFAVGNALLEEALFRGVLQDAVASQVGVAGGVLAHRGTGAC